MLESGDGVSGDPKLKNTSDLINDLIIQLLDLESLLSENDLLKINDFFVRFLNATNIEENSDLLKEFEQFVKTMEAKAIENIKREIRGIVYKIDALLLTTKNSPNKKAYLDEFETIKTSIMFLVNLEEIKLLLDKANGLYLCVLKNAVWETINCITSKISINRPTLEGNEIANYAKLDAMSSSLLSNNQTKAELELMMAEVKGIEAVIDANIIAAKGAKTALTAMVNEIDYRLEQIDSLLMSDTVIQFEDNFREECESIRSSVENIASMEEAGAVLIDTTKLLTNLMIRSIENMLQGNPDDNIKSQFEAIKSVIFDQGTTLDQAKEALSQTIAIHAALKEKTEKAKAIEGIKKEMVAVIKEARAFLRSQKSSTFNASVSKDFDEIENKVTQSEVAMDIAQGALIDAIRLFIICILIVLENDEMKTESAMLYSRLSAEQLQTIDEAKTLLLQAQALYFKRASKENARLKDNNLELRREKNKLVRTAVASAAEQKRGKFRTDLGAAAAGVLVGVGGATVYFTQPKNPATAASAGMYDLPLNNPVPPKPTTPKNTGQFSAKEEPFAKSLTPTTVPSAATSSSAITTAILSKAKASEKGNDNGNEYNGYAGTVCERTVKECLRAKRNAVQRKIEECAQQIKNAYGFNAHDICSDIKVGFEDVNVDCAPIDQESNLKNPSDATCAALIKTQSDPYDPY